jgi:hypothetical protein
MEDESIMFSDDGTIELTTQRILEHRGERTRQIMLEDFKNYEFKTHHIGNYRSILIVFSALTIIAILFSLKLYYSELAYTMPGVTFWNYLSNGIYGFAVKICAFFLILSLFFFLISRRYFVQINGKFNSIEFRIISPHNASVKKFLTEIERQSKNVKKNKSLT